MKKKTIILIAAAVLVLCVAAAILLFQLKFNDLSTKATQPEDVMLGEFESMLAEADRMLDSGGVITMNNHEYLVCFVNDSAKYYPEAFSYTDTTYSIDTAKLVINTEPAEQGSPEWKEQHTLRYLLFLTQIIEKYSDSLFLAGRFDDHLLNIPQPPTLCLCYEYRTAGYESPAAYCSQYDDHGRTIPMIPLRDEIAIYLYKGNHYLRDTNYYYQFDTK